MTTRRLAGLAAVLGAALLLGGCASGDGVSTEPVDPGASAAPTESEAPLDDAEPGYVEPFTEAVWLQDGVSIVLLTYGSSGCVPEIEGLEASGQDVTVTFVDGGDRVCTADFSPRLTDIGLDQDVSRTEPVALTLVGDNLDDVLEVAPLPGEVGIPTDPFPSVAWLQQGTLLAVQNYGSGTESCNPLPTTAELVDPSNLELEWAEAIEPDGPCTMDLRSYLFPIAVPLGLDLTKPVTLQNTGALDSSYELPALR